MSLYDKASLIFSAAAGAGNEEVAYSIKPVEKLKVDELVTNGDFSYDGDWTEGTGWSISDGKATKTAGTAANLHPSSDMNLDNNKYYRVTYTISDRTAGQVRVKLGNSGYGKYRSADGTYSEVIQPVVTTFDKLQFNTDSTFAGSIDNVSVKEVEQKANDLSFTRASDLTATYEGADGLIKKTRENLLTYSNDFSAGSGSGGWAKSADGPYTHEAVVSAATITGYDGSTNAWKILALEDGDTDVLECHINQEPNTSGVQTFSVYAQAGNVNYIRLLANAGGSNPNVFFELTGNGAATYSNNVIDKKIERIGSSDWYRCSITFDKSITQTRIQIADGNGNSDGFEASRKINEGDFIYIQSAQLEQGLVATPYIHRTDSYSKSTAGIQEDEPRYDYSLDNTLPPVLMLEPERQNLLTHSEYFSDWTDESASVTDNATTSPEGLVNAAKLIPDSGTGGNRSIAKNFTGLSDVHTFSVFAKAAGHDYISLRMRNPGNSFVMFDLSDGSVENEVSGSGQYVANSAKIESFGNDWYRCSASFDPSESTTVGQLLVSLSTGIDGTETSNFNGDGTNGVFVYGAQLEKGDYATSYIPTYGSAGTRKQDRALLGGYKAADKAWTVFMDVADFTNVSGESQAGHFFFRSSASNQVSSLFFYNQCFGYPKVGGGPGYICGKLGSSPNSFTGKFAVTYDGESTIKVFVDGTLEGTATNADPTYARGIQSGSLQYNSALSRQSKTVKQLIIFPEALEDPDAVSLTT